MNPTFLGIDVETGGLDKDKHSLLTLNLTILSEDLDTMEELDLCIKHDTYHVTAEALRINKINLIEHDAKATSIVIAQTLIDNMLSPYTRSYKTQLMLLGHNPSFDRGFMEATFKSYIWQKAVRYHMLDSVSGAVLMKYFGKMDKDQSVKLEKLTQLFGIPHDSHTARGDNQAAVAVLKKFKEMIDGKT
jgi:DNA polymerase III epsilon subunit-like protein